VPHLDGVEATRRINDQPGERGRVLIVTTFDLDDYVHRALSAGASGFLLKDAPPEQLVDAVRVIAAGDALLAPSVTRRLIERFTTEQRPLALGGAVDHLTEREQEVLGHLARGRSNAEIAATLTVSETTVKTHVGHVLGKLGLRDRVQAVVWAYEHGVVRPGNDAVS
jgi:DNA-binding NarL/FixJ family response regulator